MQDVLIYGIGAQTNDFNTPGVQEHAFFFKELTDARKAGTVRQTSASLPQDHFLPLFASTQTFALTTGVQDS